jgi:hypothetical protein
MGAASCAHNRTAISWRAGRRRAKRCGSHARRDGR